jgi:hypothetical protein
MLAEGESCAPKRAHRSDAPASGTVPPVPVALVPLPSEVPVTCSPMSMPRTWSPPEAHVNTGRLCSAGSARYAFPDVHALMRPSDSLVSFGHRSGLPSPMAYRRTGANFFTARLAHLFACRAPERISPVLRVTGSPGRETRASQVAGPSSSCVPWSKTPSDATPPRPLTVRSLSLSGILKP